MFGVPCATWGDRVLFPDDPMTTTLPADKIEAVVASGSIRRISDKPVLETARNEGAAAEGDHELVRLLLPALPRIKPGNLAPISSEARDSI